MATNFLPIEKKLNYVDIFFTGTEKKHIEISYRDSCAMQINSPVRHKVSVDANGDKYRMIVLDEAMESINKYAKQIVVGKDKRSFILHSPNISVARKSAMLENK